MRGGGAGRRTPAAWPGKPRTGQVTVAACLPVTGRPLWVGLLSRERHRTRDDAVIMHPEQELGRAGQALLWVRDQEEGHRT